MVPLWCDNESPVCNNREKRESAHLEDALQVGVVGSKAVVGGRTSAEEERHWVPFIPKGGLHPNEDIAKLPAIDQQVLALRVQLPYTCQILF